MTQRDMVYTSYESLVVIGEVYCTGTESELLECSHANIGKHHCKSYTDFLDEDTQTVYDEDILISCYGMDL